MFWYLHQNSFSHWTFALSECRFLYSYALAIKHFYTNSERTFLQSTCFHKCSATKIESTPFFFFVGEISVSIKISIINKENNLQLFDYFSGTSRIFDIHHYYYFDSLGTMRVMNALLLIVAVHLNDGKLLFFEYALWVHEFAFNLIENIIDGMYQP